MIFQSDMCIKEKKAVCCYMIKDSVISHNHGGESINTLNSGVS